MHCNSAFISVAKSVNKIIFLNLHYIKYDYMRPNIRLIVYILIQHIVFKVYNTINVKC